MLLSTHCVHGSLENPSEAVSEVTFNIEPHLQTKAPRNMARSCFGGHTATLVHPFM